MTDKAIYFDNAATGFPKPPTVIREAMRAFTDYGGNPGRSGHILSVSASREIYKCREEICSLLNFDSPERVVFTQNTTQALNFAIKGLVKSESHILISNLEHNSVIRPVHALANDERLDICYSSFDASSEDDSVIVKNFIKGIRCNTRMAVVTAASNICGHILPIKQISEICRSRGITIIIDAAQACGEVDIDLSEIKPDAICCAGHKGLYGPPGTGFAVFSKETEPLSIIQGGNGTMSEIPEMLGDLPERLEAGTMNTVGICGLMAGIRHIKCLGINEISEKTRYLREYITDGLSEIGAIVYGDYKVKTPIILFNIPGKTSSEVASYLDEKGIYTRSGLHCAPTAHRALATGDSGAVRVSLGFQNTKQEAYRFLSYMKEYVLSEK